MEIYVVYDTVAESYVKPLSHKYSWATSGAAKNAMNTHERHIDGFKSPFSKQDRFVVRMIELEDDNVYLSKR